MPQLSSTLKCQWSFSLHHPHGNGLTLKTAVYILNVLIFKLKDKLSQGMSFSRPGCLHHRRSEAREEHSWGLRPFTVKWRVSYVHMLSVLTDSYREWAENLVSVLHLLSLIIWGTELQNWNRERARHGWSSNLDYWENQIKGIITPLPIHPFDIRV